MAELEHPKTTTIAELRRPALVDSQPVVRMGWSDLQGFELMQRGAKALAASSLVPKEYVGNVPNCLIALELASRIGASPLMVTQNLYLVHGRPGWSAQFMISCFNQCGRFSAIRYDWVGERGKDNWGCRAWATEKATNEKIQGPLITMDLAKKEGWSEKSGSKWKTIPELMLTYRAASWLVRTHAPEIGMGLQTAEEIHDVYDARKMEDDTFAVTTDELRASQSVDKSTGEIKEEPTYAPQVTQELLLGEFANTDDIDVLDAQATMIGELQDFDQRNTVTKAYQARRSQLIGDDK